MKKLWWKILSGILLLYSVIVGFMISVPDLHPIHQSIRNLFFHVPMWFTMFTLFVISFIYSLRYLRGFRLKHDLVAAEAANTGIFFGVLGLITGMIWAKFTWGTFWTLDPQLNGAGVSMLIYLAYAILRNSLDEEQKRAKVAAVYNIFAFVLLVIFLGILPRLSSGSLHPGVGGQGSTIASLDNSLRLVFYPAAIGWILTGLWILQKRIRIRKLKDKIEQHG